MENKKDYINPWTYDYSGDDGTGMITQPSINGVNEEEMNSAIETAVNNLVNGAPEALDTLGEIAEAIENDEDIEAALVAQIAKKLDTETYDAEKENFATKDEIPTVPTKVSELENDSNFVTENDLGDYAEKSEVYTKTEADAKFLTEHQDISNLATKEEVSVVEGKIPTKVSELENDANYLTEHQSLEEYAKIEDVYTKEQADAKFLTEHQSLEDYATKAELELKANSADLATVATSGSYNDLSDKPVIPTVPENVSAFTNDAGYLTEHQDLSAYINAVSYNSDSKQIEFKHDNNVLDTIDATPFIKDGMVNSVVIENGNLVITFNTDSGKEPITIALSEIFNPSNYYTKVDSDALFATKTEMESADNAVKNDVFSKIWSKPTDVEHGWFQTKYTNPDGSVAQLWNESDGGGALYENKTAGIKSFVGVNADGADGVCVQIYSKNVSTNVGSRLNVNPNGMFYGVGSSASTDAGNELAVKNDITADRAEIDAIIGEKDAMITSLKDEVYSLKKVVGDIGGNVTYDMPGEGKTFNTLMSNNGTVKLSEDVSSGRYGPGMSASNTTTLNLNGHALTINPTGDYPSLLIRGSQNITIKGTGANSKIINETNSRIVWNSSVNATVNIQSGNFIGAGSGSEVIYCENGIINITGGTFRNSYEDKRYLLNCKDDNFKAGTAKIIVSSTSKTSGPKFYDFDPSNNPEGKGTTYVAEGNHVISSVVTEDGVNYTVYTVVKDE